MFRICQNDTSLLIKRLRVQISCLEWGKSHFRLAQSGRAFDLITNHSSVLRDTPFLLFSSLCLEGEETTFGDLKKSNFTIFQREVLCCGNRTNGGNLTFHCLTFLCDKIGSFPPFQNFIWRDRISLFFFFFFLFSIFFSLKLFVSSFRFFENLSVSLFHFVKTKSISIFK